MSATLKTVTLGCKVNQYETEYVREGLESIGYRPPADEETADLCVVNTCTVTSEGDSKSRQVIRRLARDNPNARIVVMGCYATRRPEEIAELPGVAEVVTDKRELPDLLGRFGVVDLPTGISRFGDRSRAYVKVQDGCLLRCSYCIIPQVRPQLTSRPLDHILDEIRRLVDNGYREIVLTGVHLGHYGVDWNWNRPKEEWTRLSHLMRAIDELDGEFRIRLSSIEATEVTRELIDVIGEMGERICPHLHVCLQSGSNRVLRRMRRRWGVKMFVDRCQMLRDAFDEPALTTDVIVGFPGETEAEFAETVETVRKVGFSKIHTFPFSARQDTPAADLPGQLSKAVKSERSRALTEVEHELRDAYYQRLIGRPLQVLIESTSDSDELATGDPHVVGTSCRYAPVATRGDESLVGKLLTVTPTRLADDRLVCGM